MPDAETGKRKHSHQPEKEDVIKAIEEAVGIFGRLQVIMSVLLRLGAFLYLRWVPNTLLMKLMHFFYAFYFLGWSIRQLSISKQVFNLIDQANILPAKADLKSLADRVEVENQSTGLVKSNGNKDPVEHKVDQNGTEVETEKEALIQSLSVWELTKVIFLGRSTRSSTINLLSLGFHTLLFLFFLDAAWTPYIFPSHHEHNLHFAHVGALGPKTATIHVRYPFPLGQRDDYLNGGLIEQIDESGTFDSALRDAQSLFDNPEPLRVVYREVRNIILESNSAANSIDGRIRTQAKRWERGPLLKLGAESDWTGSAKIEGLWPATEYEWRLAFAHNSTFTSVPSHPRKFITWPDPRLSDDKHTLSVLHAARNEDDSAPFDDPNHFTFGSSSCIKPDFPWTPTQFWAWSWILRLFNIGNEPGGFALRNRIQGFDKLADRVLDGRDRPLLRFFVQLGDVIYGDVPYWGGPFALTYRKLYRNLFASESFRRVYERLPIMGIYDDHEVVNNWGGNELVGSAFDQDSHQITKVTTPEAVPPATKAWYEYIGSSNPDPLEPGQHYYTFRYGDTAFFVMDCRRHRSPWQIEDDEDKTMLGQQQKEAFIRWLGAVNSTATFKFVVSSIPFTTLWGGPLDYDSKTDSWAAYTHERDHLMTIMQYIPNIIVLSGDRHEFASVGIAPVGTRSNYHPVTEFSTSPLNMFYLPVRTLAQGHNLGATGAERLYKYLPDGNIKWSEFEVDTRDVKAPIVHVKVIIDGDVAWKVSVHGTPIHKPRNAIGGIAKSFLELLNWRPRRWF
ncbi:hypothetical protein L7F22_044181 [Adiantum nelumboides]|nr:hypothetical protein [Adiantum nelumboides]